MFPVFDTASQADRFGDTQWIEIKLKEKRKEKYKKE